MTLPEAAARANIDRQLERAGWCIQDRDAVNLHATRGVAVREVPLGGGYGQADYLLFVDGGAAGVVEAKAEGATLTGVEVQSKKYGEGVPSHFKAAIRPLPFLYESTGVETRFTNRLDPEPRSRGVFSFHRPETLALWSAGGVAVKLATEAQHGPALVTPVRPPGYGVGSANLRRALRELPSLAPGGLWPAQHLAIRNLERSLAQNRPRALIQMATGSGKTFMAVNSIYRLVKHAGARRVLFLVDRGNLGKQAKGEFDDFVLPDDGRKFSQVFNVQRLTSGRMDGPSRVCISTIQRLYSILQGEELPEEADEASTDEYTRALVKQAVPVAYNPAVPPEFFDVVFIDECHRSIYTLWKQVLDYFDAFLVGLTATPSKQTFGFFNRNLVMEYGHEQAVADHVNVDFEIYRIRTRITERGSRVEAGLFVDRRDRETRRTRWEKLDDDLVYGGEELDRSVVAVDQIRTVARTLREKLTTELFAGRADVPKTLIFAKDDAHADDIVRIVREEFGKGNDFAQKITYKTTGAKTEDLITAFRNSYNPRIAVTVDMIATGTDIKPLEVVVFMRDVKSRVLFEQMKGRGVRVMDVDDFRAVTPDGEKTGFILVDCVGVTERELSDSRPLERQPTVSFQKLLDAVAFGATDPDLASSLAGRLARLDLRLGPPEKERIREAAGGQSLQEIAAGIVAAIDPDAHVLAAREMFGLGAGEEPAEAQVTEAAASLIGKALEPLASNPKLRNLLSELKSALEQTIDAVSQDEVLEAAFSPEARKRARALTRSFEQFLEQNRDEIAALQLLYGSTDGRRLTHEDVNALARAIQAPPRAWTTDALWRAYETLDAARVRGAPAPRVLTNIVALVRFALHRDDELEPFPDRVGERYEEWLDLQQNRGRTFTAEQKAWLEMIRDVVAANIEITRADFDLPPLNQQGGLVAAYRVFGDELDGIMEELIGVLAA
jgi:type I restriction enzyme R subunit